jgi:putative transposase
MTANRLGISKRAIQLHCEKGNFEFKTDKVNGRDGYLISVESMFKYYSKIGDWDKCERLLDLLKQEPTLENLPNKFSDKIIDDVTLAKFQVAKLFDTILELAEKKTEAGENFVKSFNNGAYPNLKNLVGEISLRSLYRWREILIENNWDPDSLCHQYKAINVRSVSNKEAEVLIPLLLNPNRPLISEIISQFKKIIIEQNPGYQFKSDITYRRFIQDWTRKNIDLFTLGRYGMKTFNDKILKDVLRDKDRVELGDIVVADGHKLNVMVINPITGKPARMTLIMFYDFKSDMPLGWEIMPTENVLAIASALRRTILLLGRFFDADGYIPRVAYLDNGRAFKAKFFTGIKDLRDTIIPGLFEKLNIKPMFATPYHGQSKTIERWFRTLGEMERRLPSYTGTNIVGKPAMLLRNEKLHRRLFDNTPITIETLQATLQAFIEEYASTPHQQGQYKGLTPAEVFMHSIEKIKNSGKYTERIISKKELIYLMMSDDTRVVNKNGIRFRGEYYWNEEMVRIVGSQVEIKYDIWNDSEIYVFENGRMLFVATKDDRRVHPAARLLGDEEDVRVLQEALAEKNRIKYEVVGEFKELIKNTPYSSMRGELNSPCPSIRGDVNTHKRGEIKKKKGKEYFKLIGYKPFANPVEELLNRNAK